MRKTLRWTMSLALAGVLAGAYGCGGGGSGGDTADAGSAALTASVELGTLAKTTSGADLAPVDVYAVNEQGVQVDAALGVTDSFTLNLPWDHDYVLIFSDSQGILGAMVYGDAEQAAFSVDSGVLTLDLGQVIIDPDHRKVKVTDASDLKSPAGGPHMDTDDDGIPDDLDSDRDNDGIPNDLDKDDHGRDLSQDHDNDGIDDMADADDDDDGIDDRQDHHPRDVDNDGHDDDRDQCDKRASRGAQLWADNGCAECHGADGSGGPGAPESIRDVNVNEIVHALKKGIDDDGGTMPAYPRLVRFGPDFRAFLGCGGEGDGTCSDGNAVNGEVVFLANCAGCHEAADLRGESAEEIEEVLLEGEDDMMAMPNLAGNAADIAAYLAGCSTDGGTPPADSDGDGITDDRDLCPGTPVGTAVDADGCPVVEPQPSPTDTDGDGVTDDLDLCPDTPVGTAVDADGCPVVEPPPSPTDTDGDGVPDTADLCANTPAGVIVDTTGCPLDGDGDGVPDYLDACQNDAGPASNNGCPVAPPTIDAQGIYDGQCAGCHRLGSYDASGSAPNLSGVSRTTLEGKFVGRSHNGRSLNADQITAMLQFFASH